MTDDLLDRLTAYRPGDPDDWTPESRATVRAGLFDDLSTGTRLRFRPRHRFPATAAAAAAVVALIGAVVLATTAGDGGRAVGTGPHPNGPRLGGQQTGGSGTATGAPWAPPAGLSDRAELGDGQWAYTVQAQSDPDATGNDMTMRDYTSPDGDLVSIRTGSQTGCQSFPREGGPSLDFPTVDFLATLPTDVDELSTYLRSHVQGSSSHDEAVFVVVGDLLRQWSALASPKLRAALLGVLSRLPEVTLHTAVTDDLGRAAIRADFVDQPIRPGEVHAYYFDTTDFRLLEERFASNGQPSEYVGPSPAYSGVRTSAGVDPAQFADGGFRSVTQSHSVVDSLPAQAHC